MEMDKPKIVGALILIAYASIASSITQSKAIVLIADVISGAAVIGIAVLMYPLFKDLLARPYLLLKSIEGGFMITAGILFLFSTKAHDAVYFVHTYVFIVSAFIFYYLLYKEWLVPRFIPVWGMIGVILLLAANAMEILGNTMLLISIVGYAPIILNEVFMATWFILKGWR